ncbi:hypothetical protein BGZ95_007877 [Linnemannia exigua]|uniref:NADAR domain-containing protein n=1 Tax=Linnemannia exigua TaxID=604196 RepID=A0AAD4DF16_9FUNG|nr:hypothetical protein BGZ95_007877 [Linnemannia exigua]
MKDNINFYRQENAFGEFSNFYYAPITIAGQEWPTTEHYFQAQKFAHLEDKQYVELVRLAKTPSEAAKLGRNRAFPLRPDWEEVKDDVMRDCVLQKFLQHPGLAEVLQGTGDRYLNEHTRNDRYWADGGDGKGKNMLGVVLMETRAKIAAMTPKQIEEEVAKARSQ